MKKNLPSLSITQSHECDSFYLSLQPLLTIKTYDIYLGEAFNESEWETISATDNFDWWNWISMLQLHGGPGKNLFTYWRCLTYAGISWIESIRKNITNVQSYWTLSTQDLISMTFFRCFPSKKHQPASPCPPCSCNVLIQFHHSKLFTALMVAHSLSSNVSPRYIKHHTF